MNTNDKSNRIHLQNVPPNQYVSSEWLRKLCYGEWEWGDPKRIDSRTVAQLKQLGYYGLYRISTQLQNNSMMNSQQLYEKKNKNVNK